MIRFKSLRAVAVAAGVAASVAVAPPASALVQAGFALDSSGSITAPNWSIIVNGLADALDTIPTDSSAEITIVGFGSNSFDIAFPTVIDSPMTLMDLTDDLRNAPFDGGGTAMSAGIDRLVELMTGSPEFAGAERSIINISTDGVPNSPQATIQARDDAIAAGIDFIAAEAIGDFVDIDFLRDEIAFPQPGLEMISGTNGFVVEVDDFDDYGPVIAQKIRTVIDMPLPASILFFVVGLGALALRQRLA